MFERGQTGGAGTGGGRTPGRVLADRIVTRDTRIKTEELGTVLDLQAWLGLHSVDPTDPSATGIAGGAGRRAGSDADPDPDPDPDADADEDEDLVDAATVGTPGQTGPPNLGPLTRGEHNTKTHGLWTVTSPHPDVFLWRSPHGHWFLSTNHGTQHLGPLPDTGHPAQTTTGHPTLELAAAHQHRSQPLPRSRSLVPVVTTTYHSAPPGWPAGLRLRAVVLADPHAGGSYVDAERVELISRLGPPITGIDDLPALAALPSCRPASAAATSTVMSLRTDAISSSRPDWEPAWFRSDSVPDGGRRARPRRGPGGPPRG